MKYNVIVRSQLGRIELQHRGLTKGTAQRYASILRKQVDTGWTVSVEPVVARNPNRPPKKWWNDCVSGVKTSGSAIDSKKVCGSLWYHKMTESNREAAIRRHERNELNSNSRKYAVKCPPVAIFKDGFLTLQSAQNWAANNCIGFYKIVSYEYNSLNPNPIGILAPVGVISGIVSAFAWLRSRYNRSTTIPRTNYEPLMFVPRTGGVK